VTDKNQLSVAEAEELASQIRNNVAFENMVVSVLAGAFSGGAMLLALNLARMVLSDLSFTALVSTLLETVFVAIAIFLVGFFTSVAIGAPLFAALEKRKRRNVWPYLVASLAVALVAFAFSAGGLPTSADMKLDTLLVIVAPAIIIALTFARLMGPHWRAAEKAEEAAAAGPVYFKLH
jgi:uncharacterized membrane-anchored protein